MCRLHNYGNKLWDRGEYFSFIELEGIDRRHAVLEISTIKHHENDYSGEVFDIYTKNTVWRGDNFRTEDIAFKTADEVLIELEQIHGFGSLSLAKYT